MMIWPEVFKTGDLSEIKDNEHARAMACATALEGWAICMSGKELSGPLPDKFGEVMAGLSSIVGCSGTPESFSEAVKEFIGDDQQKGDTPS